MIVSRRCITMKTESSKYWRGMRRSLGRFLGPKDSTHYPEPVLEVNLNDGERVITAKNLQARALKKNEIKVPSHGMKTTQADFRKMVDEHTARMRANGADIIIR